MPTRVNGSRVVFCFLFPPHGSSAPPGGMAMPFVLLSVAAAAYTAGGGTNCAQLTSCELCLPYNACGWCASLGRCLNADPFSPTRRPASPQCFAPAWMHGVEAAAAQCETAHCHSRDQSSCHGLKPECGWCTQSGLCLPLLANASCGTGGWLGVGPNAAAAWVPTPPRRPPKRPPCRYPRPEEASVLRPPSDAPDNALEAPSEWVPMPAVHGEPCALPPDVAAADKGMPTARSVLRAANEALQREEGRTVRRPEVQPPPRPVPLSEWGGRLEAGLLEARNSPAVV
jgi:hypothetical protein